VDVGILSVNKFSINASHLWSLNGFTTAQRELLPGSTIVGSGKKWPWLCQPFSQRLQTSFVERVGSVHGLRAILPY